MNLKKTSIDLELISLQGRLSKIPNINCGGCGIATLILYRWLKKHDKLCGDEMFVYLYDSKQENYTHNQKALQDKTIVPTAATHVCLYHAGKYIDSQWEVLPTHYSYLHNITHEEFVVNSINNINSWNSYFERKDILSLIEELELDFSDILI